MASSYPNTLSLGRISLTLPTFFPSISSLKTALSPLAYLQVMNSLRHVHGQYLVSAFDVHCGPHRDQLHNALAEALSHGMIVLMDSGNYESFWMRQFDRWKIDDYHNVIADTPYSFAFGFDDQSPPESIGKHVTSIVNQWEADQRAADGRIVVPIIHGSRADLPAICFHVARLTHVPMIAVAERCLGDGITERLRTVQELRNELNSLGDYVAIHLLGTGNPISIALFSCAGADSFDGLEWCQTVVDHETKTLHHLSHADFFRKQTRWGDLEISFHPRVLAHNLTFYADWMAQLQRARKDHRLYEFAEASIPSWVWQYCAQELRWGDPPL